MKKLAASSKILSCSCGAVYTGQLYLQGYGSLIFCPSYDLLNVDRCHQTSVWCFHFSLVEWEKKLGQETWNWSKGKYSMDEFNSAVTLCRVTSMPAFICSNVPKVPLSKKYTCTHHTHCISEVKSRTYA